MIETDLDNVLDFRSIIHLTESVATKIQGVFDQEEIFRILSEEFKKSKKYKMITLLLGDDGDTFIINTVTIPDTQLGIIERLIGKKGIGYTAAYKDLTCFHRAIEEGETYSFPTIDFFKQMLPDKVSAIQGAIAGPIQNISIVSPIKIQGKVIGVFGIDMPEAIAFADYFKLSVKNLTQHLSKALDLAETYALRKKLDEERVIGAEALNEKNQNLQTVIQAAKLGVWDFDMLQRSFVVNEFLANKLGYQQAELTPLSYEGFLNLIHPDDHKVHERSVAKYLKGHSKALQSEYRLKSKSGNWMWYSSIGAIVGRDDNGTPTRLMGTLTDISKIKHQEEKMQAIFQSPSAGIIVVIGEDGAIREWNRGAEEVFGYSSEEVLGQQLTMIIPERYRSRHQMGFNEALKIGVLKHGGKRLELHGLRKNGKEFPMEFAVSMWQTNGDTFFSANMHDITARKKAEQKLQRSDAILQEINSLVLVTDLDGNITFCSSSTEAITGYSREEILGTGWWERSFESAAASEEIRKKAYKPSMQGDSKKRMAYNRKVRFKDGSMRWFEFHHTVANDQSIISVAHDITDRLASEQEIQKLSQAMKQSPASVMMTDIKGNINYVNPKFEESTGYTAAHVIGKTPRFLHSGHTSKEEYAELWETIMVGKTWTGVFHNKRRNGTLFWERASIGPIFNDKGEITNFLAVKEDITQLKEAEQELENTLRTLEVRVEERTAQLRIAKEEIERIHNDFQDSLTYAKRIQESIIPSDKELMKLFRGVFSIYKPKDIISGDFYWCHDTGDDIVFVMADCTGHGVPGALMSMAGHELLDSIVIGRKITRTDVILEEMNFGISKLFRRNDARFTMDDGMDMSVVRIDRANGLFSFSGALSHGLFIKKDDDVTPLIPDKVGIGGSVRFKIRDFNVQRLEYEPGDRFYLFSDGFYDQFGGPKTKKMMRKRFMEMITASSNKTMSEQRSYLEQQFDDWRGSEEQIDDVTVIGIEL